MIRAVSLLIEGFMEERVNTVTEHMPADHQEYLEWNGDRFRRWASQIGACTGWEVMSDKQDKNRHADIWNLLYEYADIRDELEDTLTSFRLLHEKIKYAMVDITEEL